MGRHLYIHLQLHHLINLLLNGYFLHDTTPQCLVGGPTAKSALKASSDISMLKSGTGPLFSKRRGKGEGVTEDV